MSNKSYLSVYARSFSWAGFFLPKETFKKCSALYDFCRVADNIADDDDEIENKEKKFLQFENDFNKKNLDELDNTLQVMVEKFAEADNRAHDLRTRLSLIPEENKKENKENTTTSSSNNPQDCDDNQSGKKE